MSTPASERIPVIDVDQAFPTMVERESIGAPGGSAVLGDQSHQVRSVLRDVLGLRTRTEDPKAFTDALAASFRLERIEGHVEARYLPHSFAASDLGYITGGQASLYKRASLFGREITTILDGLRPLRNDADRDDTEAYRTLVRDAVTATVEELGTAGGPRVELVNSNFQVLTGVRAPLPNISADSIGGQLGALRDRFGLTDDHVNTPEEEGARTLFVSMVDMVVDLYRTWESNVTRFASDAGRGFLGTDLVWLSRVMEAAADQVDELERVLDSVMIGAAERRTIPVNTKTSLTLDGLLSWLRRFLTYDGRRIIQDTGRDGIVSTLTPMALTLLRSYQESLADNPDLITRRSSNGQENQQDWSLVVYLGVGRCDLPAGMKTARVRIAVASLGRLLTELARGALRIGRWPEAMLLTVTLRPLARRKDLVEVVVRGLNLQASYIPAFAREPLPDITGCDVGDIDDAALVRALQATSSADDDTVSGIFRFDQVAEALDPQQLSGIDVGRQLRNGVGVVLPAEDVPMVLIDDYTSRVVSAPPTISYPTRSPADIPRVATGRDAWDLIPATEHSHGIPEQSLLSPTSVGWTTGPSGRQATTGSLGQTQAPPTSSSAPTGPTASTGPGASTASTAPEASTAPTAPAARTRKAPAERATDTGAAEPPASASAVSSAATNPASGAARTQDSPPVTDAPPATKRRRTAKKSTTEK